MTTLIPEEALERAQARESDKLAAFAPESSELLASWAEQASTAAAKRDSLEREALAAFDTIGNSSEKLCNALEELEVIRGYQSADLLGMARLALAEAIQNAIRPDPYAEARFINMASAGSYIQFIKPAIPGMIKEGEKKIAQLTTEIQQTASNARIDLKKYLRRLRDESNGRLHQHLASGRLDFLFE